MDRHILPPLTAIFSSQLGREVELGKVERLSLMSVSLGASSIGPHAEEFSCGAIPAMRIYIRPLQSLQRGQVVLDAVLRNPHVLVAQKQDWSWLGIPTIADKKPIPLRHSSEAGIDDRTKVRRIAREEMGAQMLKERDAAARLASKSGYRKADVVESVGTAKSRDGVDNTTAGSLVDEVSQADSDFDDDPSLQSQEQYSNSFSKLGRRRSKDPVAGLQDEDFEEPTLAKDVERQVWRAKAWTDAHLVRPLTRKLWKRRSRRHGSVLTKSEYQNWNLQRSALAARSMFERVDRDKRRKLLSTRSSALRGPGSGSKFVPEKASSAVPPEDRTQPLVNPKEHGVSSLGGGMSNHHAFPSRPGTTVQSPRLDPTRPPTLQGSPGVGSVDELWDIGSNRDEGLGSSLTMKFKGFANRLVRQAKRRVDVSRANGWTPVALNSVYFRDATLSLLGYGDEEARYETIFVQPLGVLILVSV